MKRIIVGISGATGVEMGARLLEALRNIEDVETHLIITDGAVNVLKYEAGKDVAEIKALADVCYEADNLAAAVASGTFVTDGMIILPCSMKSLSAIANAYDDNLLVRAADVCLKERRKLVICPRETPLNQIHIKNMLACDQAGAVILPPVLSFYSKYDSVEGQIDHIIGKILSQFGIEYDGFIPWK